MRNVVIMNLFVVRDLVDLLSAQDDIGMQMLAEKLDECQGMVHSGEVYTATVVLRIIK